MPSRERHAVRSRAGVPLAAAFDDPLHRARPGVPAVTTDAPHRGPTRRRVRRAIAEQRQARVADVRAVLRVDEPPVAEGRDDVARPAVTGRDDRQPEARGLDERQPERLVPCRVDEQSPSARGESVELGDGFGRVTRRQRHPAAESVPLHERVQPLELRRLLVALRPDPPVLSGHDDEVRPPPQRARAAVRVEQRRQVLLRHGPGDGEQERTLRIVEERIDQRPARARYPDSS